MTIIAMGPLLYISRSICPSAVLNDVRQRTIRRLPVETEIERRTVRKSPRTGSRGNRGHNGSEGQRCVGRDDSYAQIVGCDRLEPRLCISARQCISDCRSTSILSRGRATETRPRVRRSNTDLSPVGGFLLRLPTAGGTTSVAAESAAILILSDRSVAAGFAIAAGGNANQRHSDAVASPAEVQPRGLTEHV